MRSVAILVGLLFGFGVANARPEKVDWSQYLESKSDRTPVRATPSPKAAKATKTSAKKVAKTKAKAKKRSAARAKKRR
jgi:hypothetical protein